MESVSFNQVTYQSSSQVTEVLGGVAHPMLSMATFTQQTLKDPMQVPRKGFPPGGCLSARRMFLGRLPPYFITCCCLNLGPARRMPLHTWTRVSLRGTVGKGEDDHSFGGLSHVLQDMWQPWTLSTKSRSTPPPPSPCQPGEPLCAEVSSSVPHCPFPRPLAYCC